MCYSLAEALWLHAIGTQRRPAGRLPDRGPGSAAGAGGRRGRPAAHHGDHRLGRPPGLHRRGASARATRRSGSAWISTCPGVRCTRGPVVQVGTWRSPLRTPAEAALFAETVAASGRGSRWSACSATRGRSRAWATRRPAARCGPRSCRRCRPARRRSCASAGPRRSAASARSTPLEFVNGGGTGSLESTAADKSVTELAAGSGLVGPTLFDAYREVPPAGRPCCTRCRWCGGPGRGWPPLFSGGYVASGTGTPDRLPTPFRPAGLRLTRVEGAGRGADPGARHRGRRAQRSATGSGCGTPRAASWPSGLTAYHLISPGEPEAVRPFPPIGGKDSALDKPGMGIVLVTVIVARRAGQGPFDPPVSFLYQIEMNRHT